MGFKFEKVLLFIIVFASQTLAAFPNESLLSEETLSRDPVSEALEEGSKVGQDSSPEFPLRVHFRFLKGGFRGGGGFGGRGFGGGWFGGSESAGRVGGGGGGSSGGSGGGGGGGGKGGGGVTGGGSKTTGGGGGGKAKSSPTNSKGGKLSKGKHGVQSKGKHSVQKRKGKNGKRNKGGAGAGAVVATDNGTGAGGGATGKRSGALKAHVPTFLLTSIFSLLSTVILSMP